jgi:ankyrin repeat protein
MQFNEANLLAASCLGIAARVGNSEAVEKLLEGGRRVDVGDNRGWTPLHEAAAANNICCLRLLLKRGTTDITVLCTKIMFQNTVLQTLSTEHSSKIIA